jgi:hypothetical protein
MRKKAMKSASNVTLIRLSAGRYGTRARTNIQIQPKSIVGRRSTGTHP